MRQDGWQKSEQIEIYELVGGCASALRRRQVTGQIPFCQCPHLSLSMERRHHSFYQNRDSSIIYSAPKSGCRYLASMSGTFQGVGDSPNKHLGQNKVNPEAEYSAVVLENMTFWFLWTTRSESLLTFLNLWNRRGEGNYLLPQKTEFISFNNAEVTCSSAKWKERKKISKCFGLDRNKSVLFLCFVAETLLKFSPVTGNL